MSGGSFPSSKRSGLRTTEPLLAPLAGSDAVIAQT